MPTLGPKVYKEYLHWAMAMLRGYAGIEMRKSGGSCGHRTVLMVVTRRISRSNHGRRITCLKQIEYGFE